MVMSGFEGLDLDAIIERPVLMKGLMLHYAGKSDAAYAIYRDLFTRHPDHAEAMYLAGMLFHDQNQHREALYLLLKTLQLRPHWAAAIFNCGCIYKAMGETLKAEIFFRQTMLRDPTFSGAYINLGDVLLGQGEVDRAIECWDTACTMPIVEDEAIYNRAHAYLVQGKWTEGWRDYEKRWKLPGFAANNPTPGYIRWNGKLIPGKRKRLLLLAEQGLGDTIMCLRYDRMLRDMGVEPIYQIQPPLVPLWQANTAAPVLSDDEPFEKAERVCTLMSLHHLLEVVPATVPTTPWIQAAPGGDMIGGLGIGFAWKGSKDHKDDANRSTDSTQWASLGSTPGTTWVSLQKDETPPEWAQAPLLIGMDTTARLIARLDLVICVDTSVAHLAGAMGKEVWVLLPAIPDSRWGMTGDTTPWYPSMRLFRQEKQGEWDGVFRRVRGALEQRTQGEAA